jgi:site-specific DNA recombinase
VAEALAQAEQEAARTRPDIEQRLASIGAEIASAEQALERYFEAFEQGKLSPERCDQRLSRLQARLEDLRAQQAELAASTRDEAGQGPTTADLAVVANQLERVIAEGEPQKTKALLRLLIQELRVDGRAQIQPTYRLVTPEVCATSEKVGPCRDRTCDLGITGRTATGWLRVRTAVAGLPSSFASKSGNRVIVVGRNA